MQSLRILRTIQNTYFTLIVLLFSLQACSSSDIETKAISLNKKDVQVKTLASSAEGISIGISGITTPAEGYTYYLDLLNYLQNKLNRPISHIQESGYSKVNELLENRKLDAAFVCSGPYVEGHRKFGLELLVVPQASGSTSYHSYLIVPIDSTARTLTDLQGKSFAFTDPKSNTGKLVLTYILARNGTTPEKYFSKYIYTAAHDASIKAVSKGIVDGASVDSLIWEYLRNKNDQYASKTKVIWKSPPYANPPFVVRKDLDRAIKSRLKEILLHAHEDPEGKEILDKMMLDKFVEINDSAYDSVRQMMRFVAQQEKK
jgi:phosphonate transport system substrate-binding protein